MAKTTGPILLVGAITVVNQTILNEKPFNWKIPIGTGLAAGVFALAERVSSEIAVGLAWVALVTVLFVRLDPNTPAPVESLVEWTK